MTIAASTNSVTLNGDGATLSFSYPFRINTTDGSDIQVSVIDTLGNVTPITSNYSVDVPNGRIYYPTVGGVSPLGVGVTALPTGWSINLRRVEPLSQVVSLSDQGFSLPTLENGLDKITMILQQITEQLGRCVQYPVGTVPTAAMLNPSTFVLTVAPLITNASYESLKAQAAAAPTTQFWGFATNLGAVGVVVFYCGNTAVGDEGFIAFGGG